MALNTRIRGAQINLSAEVVDVSADAIAFIDADGVVKQESIADLATAMAGDGLSASSGAFALDLNELTEDAVDVANDYFAFIDIDGGNGSNKESIADLVTAMAGSGLTATNGVLSVDAISNNIVEGDIQLENVSSQIDDSGYAGDFTISNTPLANSLQVYLNGLLQEEGSGKDYTISGTTITFTTAPVSGDIVIVHYITDN